MKKEFLVVYDYGQGGVWRYIRARSPEEILAKYPALEVIETPPSTLSEERLNFLRNHRNFDIDDEQDVFLASLRPHDPTSE